MSEKRFEYKGYTATISYLRSPNVWFGTVNGIKDVVTFEGSENKLENVFKKSIDDYLEMCSERGEVPNLPVV